MMFLTGAQATTYYWVGGASGDWTDTTKWNTDPDGNDPEPANPPGSNDLVYIRSETVISLGSSNIEVDGISLGGNGQSGTFSVTLNGTGTLTVTGSSTFPENGADVGIVTYRPTAAANDATGWSETTSLVLNCNVIANNLAIHSGGNVTISNGKTATIDTVVNLAGNGNVSTEIAVNGTLISDTISLTTQNNQTLTIGPDAKVSATTLSGKANSVTNDGLLITQNTVDGLITSGSSGTNTVTGAADAFVWTGASDYDWTNDANWFGGVAPTASDTTAVVNIPNVTRKPIIPAGTSLTFSADNLHIDSGAKITVNDSLTLEGTTSTLDLAKIDASSSGTLTFEGTLTNSAVYDASNLTINSGALTNSANLKCKKLSVTGASVISGTSTIESTGSGTAGGITFGGAVTQTDTLTLKSSEAVSFGADSSLENLTIAAGTSVSTTKNLTVEGNWTNNGTFTASSPSKVIFTTDDTNEAYTAISGNNTFYDLEIQRNININSDTTVHDFIANRKKSAGTNMGGRNIIFANNKKLTVQGSLNLKGNANTNSNRLTLAGGTDQDHLTTPWELECTNASASHSIQYVSFKGCTNSSASPLVLTNCTDMGGNDGYVFLGQAYEWKGGASGHTTDWTWAANWTPASIPGKGSVIKIPKGKTYYPVIKSTDNIDIDNGDTEATTANYGTITIEAENATNAAGKLDLADYNIKAKTITNNGILRLTGAAGQVFKRTDGTTATVMVNGSNSTVEYYGTGTNPTNFAWDGDATTAGKQYANLILSQATASAATTEITCSASLTINAAATLHGKLAVTGKTILAAGSGNAVILDNDANVFTGNISLGLADSDPAVAFNAGAVTIKSAGTITIDDNANAQSFDCYCEIKAQNITSSGSQIYRADLTLLGNATFTTSSSTIDFQANIKGTGYTLTLASDAEMSNTTYADIAPALVTQTGYSFTPSAGTTTFNGDVTFEDGSVNTTSGTVILKSDSTFNGSNTFKNLSITAPGKTIQFADASEQSVNGNLVLTGGTGDGNKLNLTSTGTWKINCTNPTTLEYLSVTNSNNTTTGGVVFIASNSTDNGGNTNWAFPGMAYNWIGGDSAGEHDWKNAKNWTPASIPGKGSVITIPNGKTYYPVIKSTDNIDIDNGDTGTITIEAGTATDAAGQLDLAEYSIKSKKITNNGILKLKGASTQSLTQADGTATVMENGTTSTVEYHGSGNLEKFVWDGGTAAGKQYVNLKISLALPSTSTAASEQLVVSGTTTLNAGTGNDVILSNTGNRFSGSIIAGSTESPAFIAGAVSLKSSTSVTIADKANADSLNIECPDLTLIRIQNVTSSGDQIYNGIVQISGDATLKAPASKDIKFNGTVTGATSSSLTIADPSGASTAATTYFTGNVSNLVSLSTKNVEINSTSNISITTSGTQVYDGTISLAVPQLSITASATTFKGNVSETSSSALSVTGPLTIDSACASITTTGSQTYAGAVTVATTTSINTTSGEVNFTSTTANVSGSGSLTISSGTGPITFACTAGTSTNPLNELVISSGTTGTLTFSKGGYLGNNFSYTDGLINLTSRLTVTGSFETGNLNATGTTNIRTSGDQIYNGTISGGANLTLNSHYQSGTGTITFNGDVNGTTPLAKLQTDGDVTINCENVVTSGTQTYNNAVTLGTGTPVSRKLNGSSLTFNSTIDGAKKLELTATGTGISFLDVIGGTTPPESLSITGATTIDSGCTAITTAEEQTYSGAVTTQEDSILTANSKTITFTADLNLTTGNLDLSAAGTDGGITFEADSRVTGSKTLTLVAGTNNVAFNGHAGTSTTARLNELVITSAGSTTFENKVFVSNFSDDPAHQGNITFKQGGNISNIGTGTDGTIYTTGTITIGQTGSTATLTNGGNFTHTAGETKIHGTLKGSEITLGETSGSQITIINNELFKTDDGKALSFTTSFTQTGAGKNMLGGSFSGTGAASFDTDVYLYGTGSATADFGTAGNDITIATDANLIISRDSTGALSINADTVTADNIIFYKGSVNVNGNLFSRKDIVILGGTSYSTEDSTTGYTNEYAYDAPRPSDWSSAEYTFETQFPDTSTLSRGDTSFTVISGKIFHAGKNFYANGTTLSGSSEWFIDILSNADSSVCFAEAYNSTISNCTVRLHDGTTAAGTSTPASAQIPTEICTLTSCNNFDDTPFTITEAWTTRDNVVYVKFNREVRNLNGELNGSVSNFKYHYSIDNDTSYSSIKINADGSTALDDGSEPDEIYLLSASGKTWNTDATGSDPVNTNSTDRNGNPRTTVPYIDIPRALGSGTSATRNALITDRFGKRLTHYSGTSSRFTDVLDKTGPVLIRVRTGQETHNTNLTAQKPYDSHNFIEFIYSEAVNFGPSANASDPSKMNTADWIPAYQTGVSGTANTPQNIQVSSALGYVNNTGGLTFTGLNQKITSGEIHTKQAGTDAQNVNALYRQSTHSIKYSLAGYASNVNTAGTISGSYITWPGYIESAATPSGSVTRTETGSTSNPNVTDCAVQADGTTPQYNAQIMNKPGLTVDNSEESGTNYGNWDTFAPVFLRGHIRGDTDEAPYFEAIGNGNGSTLTKIEIHVADNPSAATSPNGIWLTRYGWSTSSAVTGTLRSAAADDLIGGARPFTSSTSNQTNGGLRYCTIVNQENAFSYEIGEGASSTPRSFTAIAPGAAAPFFTSSTSDRNEIPLTQDNTYINLSLSDTNLPYKSTFTVSYDESGSYITDLAGNRLHSQPLMNTIDRTSPDFKISFSPINSNKLLLIFVKGLSNQIKYNMMNIPESFEEIIPYCFEIGTISGSSFTANSGTGSLQIDTSTPARILRDKSNAHYTAVELTLNQDTTLSDIKSLYIRLKNAGTVGVNTYNTTSTDPLTGINGSYVTFIQDSIGNYMQMYQAHAISDFASGIVNPLYAYNDNLEYDSENITQNLYQNDSWAVHDWNEDQKNYGTLLANKPVTVISSVDDTNLTADASTGDPEFTLKLYYSVAPSAGSQSGSFNSDIPNNPLRLWMPEISGPPANFKDDGLFPAYASTTNSNYGCITGSLVKEHDMSEGFKFNFAASDVQNFASGRQVSFLFGLFDTSDNQESLCISPTLTFSGGSASYSTTDRVPLLCIRLKNPGDITSLDLWSFKTKSIANQRGGVTILNNVINANNSEKTVIKVDLPEAGRLNVIVMTLDGNVITYLNRGNTKAGEHYFTWNGKNKNGASVARGMYFIRVTGGGIDETRKVMVVKD